MSATANGVPAILFEVRPSDRLFITKTSAQVNDWMADKQSELPPGVELFSLYDEADSYESRMDLIVKSAVMGLALVLMILLLTLRFSVAVWVTVGIAISFVGAFIFLPLVDVSINFYRCSRFYWF